MGRLPSGEEITDEEMMQRPADWPTWPFLPLKRSPWQTGLIVEKDNTVEPIVYLGNLYTGRNNEEPLVYTSFDAVVADGWRVD